MMYNGTKRKGGAVLWRTNFKLLGEFFKFPVPLFVVGFEVVVCNESFDSIHELNAVPIWQPKAIHVPLEGQTNVRVV